MINRKFTLIGIIVASSYGLFATGHMEAIDPMELNPEETPEVTKEHAVTQEPNKLEGIARSWMEAYYTSKEAWSSAVKFHLDESGESVASRYVGFGFGFDPNQETGRTRRNLRTQIAVPEVAEAARLLRQLVLQRHQPQNNPQGEYELPL